MISQFEQVKQVQPIWNTHITPHYVWELFYFKFSLNKNHDFGVKHQRNYKEFFVNQRGKSILIKQQTWLDNHKQI